MARPKLTVRPKEKTISLPAPIVEAVDKLLFSPLESRVPHGEWSKYVLRLIEADLHRRKNLGDLLLKELEK